MPSALPVLRFRNSSTFVQVARLFAFEYTAKRRRAPVSVAETASITRQAAGCDELAVFEDRRYSMAEAQRDELFAPSREKRIGVDKGPARSLISF